jgi:hypothetical protein
MYGEFLIVDDFLCFLGRSRDGSGLSGYMSSRSDQDHANPPRQMSPSSSNNNSNMMLQLQDHHQDQNYQFLSTLGFELLSSPVVSPYGVNSRSSSLLRSLTEPSATGKPNSPAAAFQRYQAPAMCQPAATSINGSNASFWNPSTGFDSAAYAATLEGPPPAPQSTLAGLATKVGICTYIQTCIFVNRIVYMPQAADATRDTSLQAGDIFLD